MTALRSGSRPTLPAPPRPALSRKYGSRYRHPHHRRRLPRGGGDSVHGPVEHVPRWRRQPQPDADARPRHRAVRRHRRADGGALFLRTGPYELMVKLNKIYTKTGDDGTTGLVRGPRRLKYDLRVNCFGTVDEANSSIGMARLSTVSMPKIDNVLGRIQNDLFDLGSDLATPGTDPEGT